MLKSLLALAATFAACSAVVNPANYDGECYYPLGDPNFPSNDLAQYSGRWYQVAGTFATFTLGCTCIYADYSANVGRYFSRKRLRTPPLTSSSRPTAPSM